MPTFTAVGTPVQALIDIWPSVASALAKADSLDAEILGVKNNKLPSLESGLTAVNSKADDIEAKRLQNEFDNAQKFNTWDSKLQNEISKIDGLRGELDNDIKPKTNRVLGWLGNALEVADVAGFVMDLIATSALAAAISEVGNNSVARDEALQNLINQLTQQLQDLEGMIDQSLISIIDDLSSLLAISQAISNNTTLIPQIQSNTNLLPSIRDNAVLIQNDLTIVSNGVESTNANTYEIINYVDNLPQIQSDINGIIPAIPTKVCESLNSDCFDWNIEGNCDLSEVLSKLQDVLNKIGTFPYNCSTPRSIDGNYTTVSEALQALTCGGNGSNISESLEDLFDQKDRVDEVLNALDSLPEKITLFVPEDWSIKIEGNRPQLMAGMVDKKMAGTGGASRWQIVIPRPIAGIEALTWDDLIQYFPDYTRGAFCASIYLSDNSAMRVRASSKTAAKDYLEKMLELVDPAYRPATFEPVFTENSRFKSVAVTCRGIAFYKTGRVQGEKPTKRWYYPVKEDQRETGSS